MGVSEKLRQIFGSDAQRVKYLQSRFIQRTISPVEAQELINLCYRHNHRLSELTQYQLDLISKKSDEDAARSRKAISSSPFMRFVDSHNDKFDRFCADLESQRSSIEASRANILSSIEQFKKKLRG